LIFFAVHLWVLPDEEGHLVTLDNLLNNGLSRLTM
jgi:hypothetical protein